MSQPIIAVRHVSKAYRLGAIGATSLKEELARLWGRARRRESRGSSNGSKDFWALRDVSFDVRPGEVVGHHRPERRRQIDAAEDPVTDHAADIRRDHPARARGQPARGGHRLSPGADRPREHLSQRRDPRHEQGGDPPEVRRDRGVRRGRAVHRHAGEALLERHVRAPGVRRRRPPRARDPHRRRGARGRRCRVPAESASAR